MQILRTPEARFANLPDYNFAPSHAEVASGLRMHDVDEGPRAADPVLMLHGEPSSSYLCRHMIPVCAQAGHCVIAPDLVGFGKSDKPADIGDYSYAAHVAWMKRLIEQFDFRNITLVCQDWGALIGLRLAAENEPRFARIVIGNGMLPAGHERVPATFRIRKTLALYSPWFPVGRIVAAWEIFCRWNKPFLACFSNGDPITRGGERYMQKRIPGSNGMPHATLRGGHFLQEDSPVEFAGKVNELIALTPRG